MLPALELGTKERSLSLDHYTEWRKRGRDGVDYERIFSSFCCVLPKHPYPPVLCANMSPVRILVARLKAILPLQEHCIGAGESSMSTYKI